MRMYYSVAINHHLAFPSYIRLIFLIPILRILLDVSFLRWGIRTRDVIEFVNPRAS
jgi:hypothetical protein